jgi:4,5-dihydroxyphthalate decarboxylase
VTTGVWVRGILAEEYGVDLDQVTWVLSGDEHVASYVAPPNVVPAGPGADLAEMLLAGELDAVIGVDLSSSGDHPNVAPLIPEPEKAALAALEQRGFYPINHLIVVKDDVLQKYPDAGASLFEAFATAKREYVDALSDGTLDSTTAADETYRAVLRATGADPLPYGIEPNRAMLDRLVDHAMSQRILRTPVDVDGLFDPATHGLTA